MAYIKLNNQLLNTDFIYYVDTNPGEIISINSKKGIRQVSPDEWDDIKGDVIACSNFKEIVNYGYVNLDLVVDVWKTDDNYYSIKFVDSTKNLLLSPKNTEGLDDAVFNEIKAYVKATGGGTGGTTNYDALSNKPKINSKTLTGNKTASDLELASKTDLDTKADITELTKETTDRTNKDTELEGKITTIDANISAVETSIGDTTNLKTTSKIIVDAINEIKDGQAGNTGAVYTAGDGVKINNDEISIDDTIVATKTDITNIKNNIGAVANLKTNAKIIVNAINEVKNDATYTAGDGINIANNTISVDDTVVAKKDELDAVEAIVTNLVTTVGKTTLNTTAKDLTGAVNELNDSLTNAGKIDGAKLEGSDVPVNNKILEINLPRATDTIPGIVQLGAGLKLENNITSVDSDLYMNKTDVQTELNKKQDTLTAGVGIKLENANISIDDTYMNKADTQAELDKKQNVLTAGDGLEIVGDNISAKKATHDVLGSVQVGEGLIANDGLVTIDKTKLPVLVYEDNSQSIPANTIVIHANDLFICKEDIASTNGWVTDEQKMEPVDTNTSEVNVVDYDQTAIGTDIKRGQLVVHFNDAEGTTKLYIVKTTFTKVDYDTDKDNMIETALQIDLAEYYKTTQVDELLNQKAALVLPTITAGEKLTQNQLAISDNGELTRVKEDIASYVDEATDGSKLEAIATKSSVETVKSELGTIATLTTDAKDNAVNAINELKTKIDAKQDKLTAGVGVKVADTTVSGVNIVNLAGHQSIIELISNATLDKITTYIDETTHNNIVSAINDFTTNGVRFNLAGVDIASSLVKEDAGVTTVEIIIPPTVSKNNALKELYHKFSYSYNNGITSVSVEECRLNRVLEIPFSLTFSSSADGWNSFTNATKDTISAYLSISNFQNIYHKVKANNYDTIKITGINSAYNTVVATACVEDGANAYLKIVISGSFYGLGTYTANSAGYSFGTIMLTIGTDMDTKSTYVDYNCDACLTYVCSQAIYDSLVVKNSKVAYMITG